MCFKSTLLIGITLVSGLSWATPNPVPRANIHKGDVTYFTPALGACGKTSSPSDLIVAVSSQFFNSFGNGNPNKNSICGRKVKATTKAGKSVTVTVIDKCPGCAKFDLDMSPAAFKKLAEEKVGRLHGVKWELV